MLFLKICNIIIKLNIYVKVNVMGEIFKSGFKMFVRTVFINLMSFFVVMSLIALSVAVFAEPVGYVAYGIKEGEDEAVKLYTYYNSQGEDTELSKYEKEGYTVTKSEIREIDKLGDRVVLIAAQGFALGILITFIYPAMWDMGSSDINMVKIGQKKEDKLKGLKIGVLGTVPSILVFLVLTFTRNSLTANVPLAYYKFFNASLYPVLEFLIGESKKFSDLDIWQLVVMALLLCIIPLTSHVGYRFGYGEFSIGEKLTYKKIKK